MERTYNQLHAEQAAIGELSWELQDQYKFNRDFQEQVQKLKQQNDEFHQNFPGELIIPQIQSRMNNGSKGKSNFSGRHQFAVWNARTTRNAFYSFGLAAAALFVVFMIPVLFTSSPDLNPLGELNLQGEDVTRIKGLEPQLQIFRYRPGVEAGYELLSPHDRVVTRDKLQVSLNPAGFAHGAVFSVDGRGVITLHYPSNYGASTSFSEQGNLVLPYAYELDDAPLFERFVLVLSHTPLDLRGIGGIIQSQLDRRSWVQDGVLELPNQYRVVYLPLRK